MSRRRRRKNRHTYVHTASDGKREREEEGAKKVFRTSRARGVARQTMLALLKEHFFDPCIAPKI